MTKSIIIEGIVVRGDGIGSQLGYPTANIEPNKSATLPKDGVYKSKTTINNVTFNSITFIGLKPTFNSTKRKVETHIIEHKENLYDKEIKVEILSFIREPKKFDSVDILKTQIAKDVSVASNEQ